ncbi:MAG: hypothetical protein ACRCZP_11570 [Phycicoccus sp.]
MATTALTADTFGPGAIREACWAVNPDADLDWTSEVDENGDRWWTFSDQLGTSGVAIAVCDNVYDGDRVDVSYFSDDGDGRLEHTHMDDFRVADVPAEILRYLGQ